MALAFVRSASKVSQMTDVEFFAHYGETSRIVSLLPRARRLPWLGVSSISIGGMLPQSAMCLIAGSKRTRRKFGMEACQRTV